MALMVSDWMGRMGASFVKGIKLSIPVDLFAWCFFRGVPIYGPQNGHGLGLSLWGYPPKFGIVHEIQLLGMDWNPPQAMNLRWTSHDWARPARTMAA